jgi:3-oxoacyl-[acyl-carrier protein] reductase
MLLKGKTAVITGCMQGIGLATLDLFAKEGANIFACCQTEFDEFTKHIEDLKKEFNVDIIPVYFDLTDEESIKNAAKTIMQTKKPINVLANIAGMTQDALFSMVTKEQLHRIFEINFFSQIVFTQYIVKLMLRYDGGSIINTSSISALDGNEGQLAYSAVKGAWISATKTMSIELAPKGIRVNAIAPGVIKTAMTENLPKEVISGQIQNCAIKRLGDPTEVAETICYLASDLSSFVTGQIIRIDGGIG